MIKIRYELFIITCITNMHVGSGEISFGAVDNLVQRDPVTYLPTINGSSLKGAIREFFEQQNFNSGFIEFVFGSSPHSSSTQKAGNYKFFSANLISIPVRSNKKPFFMATSPYLIGEFLSDIERFEIELDDTLKNNLNQLKEIPVSKKTPMVFERLDGDLCIEELKAEVFNSNISIPRDIFGDNLALLHHDDLKEICADLPVVARNYLEDGKSQNLWYEEIVPRQTRFYFVVGRPETEENKYFDEFVSAVTKNLVQIGANATIGYGYTKISHINRRGENYEKAG